MIHRGASFTFKDQQVGETGPRILERCSRTCAYVQPYNTLVTLRRVMYVNIQKENERLLRQGNEAIVITATLGVHRLHAVWGEVMNIHISCDINVALPH